MSLDADFAKIKAVLSQDHDADATVVELRLVIGYDDGATDLKIPLTASQVRDLIRGLAAGLGQPPQ